MPYCHLAGRIGRQSHTEADWSHKNWHYLTACISGFSLGWLGAKPSRSFFSRVKTAMLFELFNFNCDMRRPLFQYLLVM